MISSIFWICEIWGTEYQQSLMMCVNFLFILLIAWKLGGFSPFFLFLCTFSFLFIGGHFWGNLINPDLPLRVGSFMDPMPSSVIEWKKTLIYVILFMYFSLYGYLIYRKRHDMATDNAVYFSDNVGKFISLNKALYIIFWPLAVFTLYDSYRSLMLIMSSGYTSIFLSQSDGYSSNSFLLVLVQFFFAMALVYGNRKNRVLYIFLGFTSGFINILGGSRSVFGSFLLFAIWLISTRRKLDLKKFIIVGGIALLLLLFVSQISKRSQDSGTEYDVVTDMVALFVYSQGESLATFEKSREYSYPTLPYIQTFIPGSSFVYSKLFDTNLKSYETSFSLYLSQCLNIEAFLRGNGVGWTLLSDIYLFSGRTWIGYILLSFIFGFLIAMLECKSKTNMLYRVVMFAIFLRLLTLPRTGLNVIIPLIVYIIIYYFFFSRIFKLRKNDKYTFCIRALQCGWNRNIHA